MPRWRKKKKKKFVVSPTRFLVRLPFPPLISSSSRAITLIVEGVEEKTSVNREGEKGLWTGGETEKPLNNFPTSLTPSYACNNRIPVSRWNSMNLYTRDCVHVCVCTYNKNLFFDYRSSSFSPFLFFSVVFSPGCRYGRKLLVVVTRWNCNCKWWARVIELRMRIFFKYNDLISRGIFKDQRVSDPRNRYVIQFRIADNVANERDCFVLSDYYYMHCYPKTYLYRTINF